MILKPTLTLTDEQETLLHSVLYIIEKLGGQVDLHKLSKILYFADQKHIAKWGAPITDQDFIKMKYGPVPSEAIYHLNRLRESDSSLNIFADQLQFVSSYVVKSTSRPDLDNLSRSEIEALSEAIEENRSLSFIELTEKSHDEAWDSAINNQKMDKETIARAGGASEDMISYYKSYLENLRATYS